MPQVRTLTVVALWVLLFGCAGTQPRPVRSEFEDIPVPRGLSYRPSQSTIIESPSVKAARLVYRGRIEAESLGVVMRSTLEANGWRHISTTSAAKQGTVQVYEKAGNSLQVRIYEGVWFTYVVLDASRAIGAR